MHARLIRAIRTRPSSTRLRALHTPFDVPLGWVHAAPRTRLVLPLPRTSYGSLASCKARVAPFGESSDAAAHKSPDKCPYIVSSRAPNGMRSTHGKLGRQIDGFTHPSGRDLEPRDPPICVYFNGHHRFGVHTNTRLRRIVLSPVLPRLGSSSPWLIKRCVARLEKFP